MFQRPWDCGRVPSETREENQSISGKRIDGSQMWSQMWSHVASTPLPFAVVSGRVRSILRSDSTTHFGTLSPIPLLCHVFLSYQAPDLENHSFHLSPLSKHSFHTQILTESCFFSIYFPLVPFKSKTELSVRHAHTFQNICDSRVSQHSETKHSD